jgi:hypothetical protein
MSLVSRHNLSRLPGGMRPGLVSLRRFVGSRNRPLAALALRRAQIFSLVAGFPGAGFAGAVLVPAGKHLARLGPAGGAGSSCVAPAV